MVSRNGVYRELLVNRGLNLERGSIPEKVFRILYDCQIKEPDLVAACYVYAQQLGLQRYHIANLLFEDRVGTLRKYLAPVRLDQLRRVVGETLRLVAFFLPLINREPDRVVELYFGLESESLREIVNLLLGGSYREMISRLQRSGQGQKGSVQAKALLSQMLSQQPRPSVVEGPPFGNFHRSIRSTHSRSFP